MKHKKGVSKKIECNCTLSTNIPDFSPKVCLDSRRHVCDYANNVYIFLPAFLWMHSNYVCSSVSEVCM